MIKVFVNEHYTKIIDSDGNVFRDLDRMLDFTRCFWVKVGHEYLERNDLTMFKKVMHKTEWNWHSGDLEKLMYFPELGGIELAFQIGEHNALLSAVLSIGKQNVIDLFVSRFGTSTLSELLNKTRCDWNTPIHSLELIQVLGTFKVSINSSQIRSYLFPDALSYENVIYDPISFWHANKLPLKLILEHKNKEAIIAMLASFEDPLTITQIALHVLTYQQAIPTNTILWAIKLCNMTLVHLLGMMCIQASEHNNEVAIAAMQLGVPYWSVSLSNVVEKHKVFHEANSLVLKNQLHEAFHVLEQLIGLIDEESLGASAINIAYQGLIARQKQKFSLPSSSTQKSKYEILQEMGVKCYNDSEMCFLVDFIEWWDHVFPGTKPSNIRMNGFYFKVCWLIPPSILPNFLWSPSDWFAMRIVP
jgi:hypothetical protein